MKILSARQVAEKTSLSAVQCPSDMIDQIGGWSTAGVGQTYGEGYSLEKKWEWMEEIFCESCKVI